MRPSVLILKYFFIAFILCVYPVVSWAQGVVNEGLETAFVYVDGTNGNDTNSGTMAFPFQTINKAVTTAVANNQSSVGTQVNIQPGTSRESVTMTTSAKDTALPMTFQAVTNGTVVISGATVLTGWTVYSGNSSIYQDAWTYNFAACGQVSGCPSLADISLRPEMMVVNGTVMTQVLAIVQMQPGTFFVDNTKSLAYLWPPSGTNVNTATIETATQPLLWRIGGKSNIVLRGLSFQYANSCRASAAVQIAGSGSNVILDTLTINWNNGQGLSISNPYINFTVQNTITNHNGDSGLQEFQTKNGQWTSDTSNFNNWRGAQGAYYACNIGGMHPFQAHNDTINGLTLAYNETFGVHWDTDNATVTATNLTSTNNLIGAVFTEKNEGPISISKSNLCYGSPLLGAGGLSIRNSTGISLLDSNVVNNPPSQVLVFGTANGIQVTNWETKQLYTLVSQNFTMTGNSIEGVGTTQSVFSDPTLNGTDWTSFVTTLVSNSNNWWSATNTAPFFVPVPKVNAALSFSAWKTTTGQDSLSTFAAPATDPATVCNSILPDMTDYWLTLDKPAPSLDPAGNTVVTTSVTSLSFSGTVNLTLDGTSEVAGLSGFFGTPSINTSGNSTVTLSATTAVAVGTYPFTIVANSGDLTRMVRGFLTVPKTSLRFSTVNLNFPTTIETSSSVQTFTIMNFGSTSISMTSYTSSNAAFKATNNCGASLAAGATCTVTITFTPTAAIAYTATLTVKNGDATKSQVVNLTGTGLAQPIATFLPGSLSFGAWTVGTTSTALTSTLTNTSTTTPLTITSITISGDFNQTNTCSVFPSTLAALGTCTFTVTFTPTLKGVRSGTVTVNDNTSSKKQTISLSGSGK